MNDITRVGVDLGKKVFHLTAVDRRGAVVERKQLRRAQPQSYLALLPPGRVVAKDELWGGCQRGAGMPNWRRVPFIEGLARRMRSASSRKEKINPRPRMSMPMRKQ